MYKRILAVVDGSASGERIVSWVRVLARACGAEIHLLMTRRASYPVIADGRTVAYSDQIDEAGASEALAYLCSIAEELRSDGLSARIEVRVGDAPEAIAAASRDARADLIALGLEPASVFRLVRRGPGARLLAVTGLPLLVAGRRTLRSA